MEAFKVIEPIVSKCLKGASLVLKSSSKVFKPFVPFKWNTSLVEAVKQHIFHWKEFAIRLFLDINESNLKTISSIIKYFDPVINFISQSISKSSIYKSFCYGTLIFYLRYTYLLKMSSLNSSFNKDGLLFLGKVIRYSS